MTGLGARGDISHETDNMRVAKALNTLGSEAPWEKELITT